MNTRLLASTLLAASLFAAPAVAFAQSETSAPPETKSEATTPKKPMHHAMKSTHMKHGTTTGMSSSTSRSRPGGESVARKPAD